MTILRLASVGLPWVPMTPGTLSLALTSPNPIGVIAFEFPNSPASSMKGSTLAKLEWLNTFSNVAWNSNAERSDILNRLKIERFAILLMLSCVGLRGVLPNGVPNTDWAVLALRIKRTWLGLTFWILQVGLAFVNARQLWPSEVTLTRVLGANPPIGAQTALDGSPSVPDPNRLQTSCANPPTLVEGALRLPRNGRAVSAPTKLPI